MDFENRCPENQTDPLDELARLRSDNRQLRCLVVDLSKLVLTKIYDGHSIPEVTVNPALLRTSAKAGRVSIGLPAL